MAAQVRAGELDAVALADLRDEGSAASCVKWIRGPRTWWGDSRCGRLRRKTGRKLSSAASRESAASSEFRGSARHSLSDHLGRANWRLGRPLHERARLGERRRFSRWTPISSEGTAGCDGGPCVGCEGGGGAVIGRRRGRASSRGSASLHPAARRPAIAGGGGTRARHRRPVERLRAARDSPAGGADYGSRRASNSKAARRYAAAGRLRFAKAVAIDQGIGRREGPRAGKGMSHRSTPGGGHGERWIGRQRRSGTRSAMNAVG